MAHGFAGIKDHGVERFAKAFCDAGFIVLVHDHRGFGASGGSFVRTSIQDGRFQIGAGLLVIWKLCRT
jgi:alpha-beta hydrolase superfamily lysophospholipase